MTPETVCAAAPNFSGLAIFFSCVAIATFGLFIGCVISSRIDRVQDDAAEKYAKRMKEELGK